MDEQALVPLPEQPEADLPSLGYYCRGHRLVYLTSVTRETAYYVEGEHSWSSDLADFLRDYQPAPDGMTRRAAQMAETMAEIAALSAEDTSAQALAGYNPHVGADGSAEGMALVPLGDVSADAAKRQVATLRNEAGKRRNQLAALQQKMKAFAEEQALILRAKADELAEILKKAEEAIWTINLYLGTNEEIVRIRDGAPAPADTPITVRQLVLYMDEELAVNAEQGGIDFQDIDWFDEWVADPDHLYQVLPEPRGIVALKPRRSQKDYGGDPWANSAKNRENRRTYFLIRNGELLYRMWTDYQVGKHLVPRTDEFLNTFVGKRFRRDADPGTFVGDYEEENYQMEPGSAEFMRAEKAADEQRRHYMRAALVLQGLIDRTPVFAPLKWRVRVNSEEAYDEAINLVLDADTLLGDGRERFGTWLARVNSELDLGCRVVGTWGNYEHGLRNEGSDYGNSRLSPARAEFPEADALYTIESRKDGGFRFLYPRKTYWGEPMERRASCVVYMTDRFVLNFDAATEDEMRFYLASRADRREYLYMYPLLNYALSQKAAEREAEVPFRLLLAGEIAKAHGVDVATATESVDELVNWWKFKNRTHRALTSDDAKATRMIVEEYGLRVKHLARRPEQEQVVAAMKAAHPDFLLLAHRAGSEFVVLAPANTENVFVTEEVWSKRGRKSQKEWRTVDKRYLSWTVLETSDRWYDWKVGASAREHLTDPERSIFLKAAWDKVRPQDRWYDEKHPMPTVFQLATCYKGGKAELFYWTGAEPLPQELLLSTHVGEPNLRQATIGWRRTAGGAVVPQRGNDSGLSTSRLPWEEDYSGRAYHGLVVSVNSPEVRNYQRAKAAYNAYAKKRSALDNKVWVAQSAMAKQGKAAIEAAEYAKFLADYGDPELWEGHLKTLKNLPQIATHEAGDIFKYLVERGIPLTGTVAEMTEAARAAGWVGETPAALADFRVDA